MTRLRNWTEEERTRKWGPPVAIGHPDPKVRAMPAPPIYDAEPVVDLFLTSVDWHFGQTIDIRLADRLQLRQLPADAEIIDALVEIARDVKPPPANLVRYVVGTAARIPNVNKAHRTLVAP